MNQHTATFSGTISGGVGFYSWVLYPGDGSSIGGGGSTFQVSHTYDGVGTYTVTMNVADTEQGQGSCETTVTIHQTTSVDAVDQVNVADVVGLAPPLTVKDVLTLIDRPAVFLNPSLLINETASFIDRLTSPPPQAINEGAAIGDQVTVSGAGNNPNGNPNNPLGGLVGLEILGGAAIVAGIAIYWKFVLPRRSPGLNP